MNIAYNSNEALKLVIMVGIEKSLTMQKTASAALDAMSDIFNQVFPYNYAALNIKKGNGFLMLKAFSRARILPAELNEINQTEAIQIPAVDCVVATCQIHSIPEFKNLPILTATAHAISRDRAISIKAGMYYYISKRIHFSNLFFILAKWLKKFINMPEK